MPLTFLNDREDPINPDYIVEDASDEEQIEFEGAMEEAEDKMKEEGSVLSVSEYIDVGNLPDRLLFGELECRAIFTQNSDNGRFHRVCGCRADACSREGHSALRMSVKGRALEGAYEPVRARKYVDGRFNAHLPKEEFFAQMEALQQERRAGVNAAASVLKNSPSGSEESEYQKARAWDVEDTIPMHSARRTTGVLKTSPRVKYPTTPVGGGGGTSLFDDNAARIPKKPSFGVGSPINKPKMTSTVIPKKEVLGRPTSHDGTYDVRL
jgi:hypothetical protein